MPEKFRQHYIFKFESDRLKDCGYSLKIDIDEARRNGELISIGASELTRIIYRLKNKLFDVVQLDQLISDKKQVKQFPDSKENRKKISELTKRIDDILFIPEILNIEFTKTNHYKEIIKKGGVIVNGKKFIRLLTGAGMARRSTVMFCEEGFAKKLKPVLENDRNKQVKLVDSKWNAYHALVSSSAISITTPRFCVIKDYEFSKERLVDFVVEPENGDDYVEERKMEILQNAFDGMGLISPEMSMQWSIDLSLDYQPTSYCVRGAFLKGQLVQFDFHKFAEEVAHNYYILDAWGNQVDIREVDVVLTISMLKLWNSYSSCQEYQSACEKNGIGWGISRYTPEVEKDNFFSSYQLLQVLDLSKDELFDLANPTVEWLKDVSGGNYEKTLLYLLGELSNGGLFFEEDSKWWNKITDPVFKALLLDRRLLGSSYFKTHVAKSLKKKMQEAMQGKLTFPGLWQVSIADPYAFCEYLFGMEVKGLLDEFEHYSKYWIDKGVYKVASGRSPLTWKSEIDILNLKNNNKINKWFGHLNSGVVFNIHGVDCLLMADSDYDFDINFSTNNPYFISGASGGKPVTYEKKMPTKNVIVDENLYLADINTMGSKIGQITNIGTTLYSMLANYDYDSPEYKEIIQRLIITRKLQGNEIDKGKGVLVKPAPKWDRWNKITETMSESERKIAEFKNKLMIWQRPKFFIYLYPKYMLEYRKFIALYENYAQTLFGFDLETLLSKKERNQEEQKIYDNYYKYNPFIDNDSNMGVICRYIEESVKKIKVKVKQQIFDISEYLESDFIPDKNKLKELEEFSKQYRNNKKVAFYEGDFKTMEQFNAFIKKQIYSKISSNQKEIAQLGICLMQKSKSNEDFVWKVLGDAIVESLIGKDRKTVFVPLADNNGEIEYLNKKYSVKEVAIT